VIKRFHKTAKDIDTLGRKFILQRRNGKSVPYLRTFEPDEKQDIDRSETLNERLERVRRKRMERLNSTPTQTFRPVIKKSRRRDGR
jgi:hypothetical protein